MKETTETRVSRFKRWINPTRWWSMLGMDQESLLLIMKCSLPPVVVVAISQSSAVANTTSTVGYLATITAISSQCLLPRAKFLRIMFFNLLATCIAASICCLASYTAVKARQHSRGSDNSSGHGGISAYNSDACVVSAIWLVVMIWFANGFRAWRPTELQDPMVAFSIFSVVTLTRSGTFEEVSGALSFISRLLTTLLLGFAIATGVSLLVLPRTCRGHIFEDIRAYIEQTQAVLTSLPEFLRSLPNGTLQEPPSGSDSNAEAAHTEQTTLSSSSASVARGKLVAAINALHTLDAKIQGGLHYSKMEVAYGKLDSSDLEEISDLLRNLLRPLSGMALLPDMLDNLAQTSYSRTHTPENAQTSIQRSEMDYIAGTLPTCLAEMSSLVSMGLQHFLIQLGIVSRGQLSKQDPQLEAVGQDRARISLDTETLNFVDEFERSLKHLSSSSRNKFVDELSLHRNNAILHAEGSEGQPHTDRSNIGIQQHHFVVLYLLYLQDIVADATVALASFSRKKVTDGTMARYRLIRPNKLSPWTWFSPPPNSKDTATIILDFPSPREVSQGIEVADLEHLVPSNIWERGSSHFRSALALIGSDLSMFGLRVSVASFCVGILAYLRQTQQFFIHQRCIWAMIVIVLGMSPTSGQTMFGFVTRVVATIFSVVLSLIAWYIVDGKTAGVIIFLFLANMTGSYVYVKRPQLFGPSIIAVITLNVIIAYELQVRKLGREVAESNGQPYYPIYIFGPYKLLAVIAGCAISFFWVVFPYPITAKSKVPRLVGESLFRLARVYSVMHTTVELWIHRQHSRPDDPEDSAHLYGLGTMMKKLNKEGLLSLHSLKMHGQFATYEPPIGGKFPIRIYGNMMSAIQQSLSLMSLMAYIGRTMPPTGPQIGDISDEEKSWTSALATAALESTDFQSHSTTSLFCHLGSAMVNAQPLPPFLSVSEPFPLARQLQRLEFRLLNIKNAQDPAFIAFISLEVLRTTLNFELKKILRNVRMLVGEVKLDV